MRYNKPFNETNPDAGYVNGNPGAGIEGSIPPAEQMEYPQREIVEVIVAAGLTPTNSDLTQLKKAIQQIITEYVDPLVPKGSNETKAFTPAQALANIAFPGSSIAQSISIKGATYLDITGYVAFRNDASSFASMTGEIQVTNVEDNIALPASQYLGCANKDSFQTPVSLKARFRDLLPSRTYRVDLVVRKQQSVGPTVVQDPFLIAFHDGVSA